MRHTKAYVRKFPRLFLPLGLTPLLPPGRSPACSEQVVLPAEHGVSGTKKKDVRQNDWWPSMPCKDVLLEGCPALR